MRLILCCESFEGRVTRISHEKVLRCRDLAETSQTLSARIPVSQSSEGVLWFSGCTSRSPLRSVCCTTRKRCRFVTRDSSISYALRFCWLHVVVGLFFPSSVHSQRSNRSGSHDSAAIQPLPREKLMPANG